MTKQKPRLAVKSKHALDSKIIPKSKPQLLKLLTGIPGLDEITGGGLPKGRPTLVCGGTGCGKTFLAMEFLVRGATQFKEPGVFISFEESSQDLIKNFGSIGFDLKKLVAQKKIALDFVLIQRNEGEETGEYDLEGLFIRLGQAIDSIGAKRVAIDTIESLFSGLPNAFILRAELRRLFLWLKSKGVTAIVTGEHGTATLTRQGLEEFVSDCVIVLDQRVSNQITSRRLRVVKYRGTAHGTNEYPFLIDENGFSVLPVTSLGLEYTATDKRISSGIKRLDTMLDGKGFYRGSSVLISGTAGTGKSSIAAHFVDAACRRGERALYFAYEESASQIIRNMRYIGIHLKPSVQKGLLKFYASRPTFSGLEQHLLMMRRNIEAFKPRVVVVDSLKDFVIGDNEIEVKSMILRLVDFLKAQEITSIFTSLTPSRSNIEKTEIGLSPLIDTWLLVRDIELGGERNRGLYILKSRGMSHSNQIREFQITDNGIQLSNVYLGVGNTLTGTARVVQEAREKATTLVQEQDRTRLQIYLDNMRKKLDAQITAIR